MIERKVGSLNWAKFFLFPFAVLGLFIGLPIAAFRVGFAAAHELIDALRPRP
jgi:hypothetical protein